MLNFINWNITGLIVVLFSFFFTYSSLAQNNYTKNEGDTPSSKNLGSLSIDTEVDSFYVVINDNFEEIFHLANEDTIAINPGEQQIRIVQKYYRDLITTVEIKPDSLSKLRTNLIQFTDENLENAKQFSSYPRIFWGVPVVLKTDPDADLYIGEKYIGKGIAKIDTTGYFTVRSELPKGKIETKTFYVEERGRQTFFIKEIYHRPEKKKARYLSALPGGSQIYQDKKIKGYALLGVTLIGSGLAGKFHLNFSNEYKKFKDTQQKYLSADDPKVAYELGNLADKQLSNSKKAANIRDALFYSTIGVYLYSLVDGLLKPEIGYRNTINIDPYIDFDPYYKNQLGISASYNF